jgi:hypothetical protein
MTFGDVSQIGHDLEAGLTPYEEASLHNIYARFTAAEALVTPNLPGLPSYTVAQSGGNLVLKIRVERLNGSSHSKFWESLRGPGRVPHHLFPRLSWLLLQGERLCATAASSHMRL